MKHSQLAPYLLALLAYLLAGPAALFATGSRLIALIAQIALTAILLYYFRKDFKLRLQVDFLAILLGILIFALWTRLDTFYPHLGESASAAYELPEILLKLGIGVILAPVVEEFFTRFFFMRWLIDDKKWQAVKLGTYSFVSFIVSVLFFGFSHNRWLAGLLTGIILNLLIYHRKNIESCVLSHAVANLALGIFVIYTGRWEFW